MSPSGFQDGFGGSLQDPKIVILHYTSIKKQVFWQYASKTFQRLKQTPQGRSKTPPRRLPDASTTTPSPSKTLPRRVQDGFRAFENQQDSQEAPKIAQDVPKTRPGRLQDAPRPFRDTSRRSKAPSKTAQESPQHHNIVATDARHHKRKDFRRASVASTLH